MALGGGTFTSQNQVLPGAYMVFISAARTGASVSDRGTAAMGLELDWGPEGEVFELHAADLQDEALPTLGHDRYDEALKGVRDVFQNAHTLYGYRLNGGGTKAENEYAKALCSGTRGNDLKIVIQANPDDEGAFDVQTVLGDKLVDKQTVTSAAELQRNDYVVWKDAELSVTAGTALSGGENGTVTGQSHQDFLDQIESYAVNAIGCLSTENSVKAMYCNFAKRMREEVGSKFQVVVHDQPADYEGVVNVKNKSLDEGWPESAMVYWATGANAGCDLSSSCTNALYDGEFSVDVNYTQAQLKAAIKAGEFTFHRVDSDVRVLTDINSLVSLTEAKNELFQANTTIRTIDEIATSIARIFCERYIGNVRNNEAGRLSLWSDIVSHHKELEELGAIENFSEEDVTIQQGKEKVAVVVSDAVTVTGAMEKLYLTCAIE